MDTIKNLSDFHLRRMGDISNSDIPFVHEGNIGKDTAMFICAQGDSNSLKASKTAEANGIKISVVQGGYLRLQDDNWLINLVKKTYS